jgi:hypothetical protein
LLGVEGAKPLALLPAFNRKQLAVWQMLRRGRQKTILRVGKFDASQHGFQQ